MALIHCNFHSDALAKACGMNVIIPQKVSTQIGQASSGGTKHLYPVLYLLHGMSDDYTIWMRRTSIERYVASLGLVVVMPDGGRSFYTDMVCGADYWTFLSEELPRIVEGFFPVSPRREDTFAAGLSMGGYGALKLALRRPDKFCFAGALSAVTDLAKFLVRLRTEYHREKEADSFFGAGKPVPPEDDLWQLLDKTAALPPSQRPQLFQACGTEDSLYADNLAFRSRVEALGAFKYHSQESPGGHTWEFWDANIQDILKALPLKREIPGA